MSGNRRMMCTIDPLTSFFLPEAIESELQRRMGQGEGKDTVCMIGLGDGQFPCDAIERTLFQDGIVTLALSIKNAFQQNDLFVRVAPAAFFVYTSGRLNKQDLEWKLSRMMETFREQLDVHKKTLMETMHIGIVYVEQETTFLQLLRKVEKSYCAAYDNHSLYEFDITKQANIHFPIAIPAFEIQDQDMDMQIITTILHMAFQNNDVQLDLELILKTICEYFNTQQIYVVEKDVTSYKITYEWKKQQNAVENDNFKHLPLSIGDHFIEAFQEYPILICSKVNDLMKFDPFITYREKIRGSKSLLLNQLCENGDRIGYLCTLDQNRERIWHPKEIATFNAISNIVNIVILQLRLLRMRYHLSSYDSLTKAWSLKKFVQITEANLHHRPQKSALVTLDIKEFKFINSEYGYAFGNRILQAIVNILQLFVEQREYFARIDGDLFVVLLEYQTPEELHKRLITLMKNIEHCSIRFDHAIQIKCMVGVYLIETFEHTVSEMIDRANIARKYIKHSHESGIAYYNGELEEKAKKEHYLSQIMHSSLQNQEFIVYYQPKVNIQTHRCIGLEALVRWKHEEEMIQPGDFIPLFEKNHFITELDLYVLEKACQQLRMWMDDPKHRPIPISVNFSRVDLADAHIVEAIIKICNQYGIPRRFIEIEVTETAFLENEQKAIEKVKELKNVGFSLSMDDFGTGFSSLSLLRELPMDVLKLDCSFFQKKMSKREGIILSNIVHMAQQLNMMVVSEGIETKEHVAFLKSIGCEIAQGYYFARPMAIEDLDINANFIGSDLYER